MIRSPSREIGVKLSADQFATVVRNLPLPNDQAAAAAEALAQPATDELPGELIRREILTEYQARMILSGHADELTIGRYTILDELGEGGMGQVLKARDTAMDRVVAVKLIRDDRFGSESAVRRFEQEVRATARLAHPNIVRAYDTGVFNDRHFLVTELIAGSDLGHELARRGSFPAGEACHYAHQTALGLQHAHEHGLIHRDIKPSNLLFSAAERTVKIADFGLAYLGDSGAGRLTAAGAVMGTPDYIAPEQASSASAADIRSDLYSLGCTLYQFLTGRVPFPADSALAKLVAHASEAPPPLDTVCPGLAPGLAAVVQKMMAKSPNERYQSPLEVAEALAPFCDPRNARIATNSARAIAVPPHSTLNNAADLTAHSAPHPEPSRREPKARSPRRRTVGLVAGAGVLVAVIIALVFISRPTPSESPDVRPVQITVKLDDWPSAREPGAVIYLSGASLPTSESEKARTSDDLKRPLELAPGTYGLTLRIGGEIIERREFNVTSESAHRAIALGPIVPEVVAATITNGREVKRWEALGPVSDLVFLPDGKKFVSMERPTGVFRRPQAHELTISGALYATETNEIFSRWDTVGSGRVALFPKAGAVVGCQFPDPALKSDAYRWWAVPLSSGETPTNDGSVVAGASTQKHRTSLLTASADGTRLLLSFVTQPGDKAVGTVQLCPVTFTDARTIAVGEPKLFPGDTACFDPSGHRLLVANGTALALYDQDTGKPMAPEFTGATASIQDVAVAPNGKYLAAGCADGAVYFWRTGTKEPIAVGRGHKGKINVLKFTPDGARVVSAGEDGTVRVWLTETGKEIAQFKHDGSVNALAISPEGKRVLTGSADATIRLWQLP
ncbi:Serine/threonine-protein kinase PknB [Gemmata sp. SH-PL17]|nr:Serine/threonine-protein kinase PknB [Gemmata sp. SH-PL17]